MKQIKAITLTVLTESPIFLSNDQGFGNYTPGKKAFYKDGKHAITSVATFTYELRRLLKEEFGWQLNDIVTKAKNMYLADVNDTSGQKMEADIFGFLIPDKQISKTSPLRVIPFTSIHPFQNDTQLITNKGFFNLDFERNYRDEKGKVLEIDAIPQTQALANEEVFGDYYTYTLTIELNRVGVIETDGEKYLMPSQRTFFAKESRLKAVQDILQALTILTRDIKHQKVLLKPLAVYGGAFASAVPYFWNDFHFKNGELEIERAVQTQKDYQLEGAILSVDSRISTTTREGLTAETPVAAMIQLANRLSIGDDDLWYVSE
ncbi:MAG: DevR family CRISPR-associated autoregulator [Culicoidibacterales bacterium]